MNIIKVIAAICMLFGIELDETKQIALASALVIIAAVIASLMDRFSKGDLHWFGVRK